MKTPITNKELNTLREYQTRCCRNCGRSPGETMLDIVTHLKTGLYLTCVDKQQCQIARTRNSKLK
jgi:hypothetical protein